MKRKNFPNQKENIQRGKKNVNLLKLIYHKKIIGIDFYREVELMNREQYEALVTTIIACSGTARTDMIEAVRYTREGKFDEADVCIKSARESMSQAHAIQTEMIQNEVTGNPIEVTLLMVHAQDHLMNAMTVQDMANELIKEIRIRLEKEN